MRRKKKLIKYALKLNIQKLALFNIKELKKYFILNCVNNMCLYEV